MSRYQKGKTNLDLTEARDSEWQWHQPGHMQVCTLLQTDNHTSTPLLMFFTGRMPFLPPNQQRQSTESCTERHWNRNEVLRESQDKEVNRRPTLLKKFRADALRGPRVSIATGWNIKSGGREEYLVSFLPEAVSAALPAE